MQVSRGFESLSLRQFARWASWFDSLDGGRARIRTRKGAELRKRVSVFQRSPARRVAPQRDEGAVRRPANPSLFRQVCEMGESLLRLAFFL